MKKITALVLVLVMVFSIGCACASDDTPTLVYTDYVEAGELAAQLALDGCEVEAHVITYGAAMLKAEICPVFVAIAIGLDKSFYNNCDIGYYYDSENSLMVITGGNVSCTFNVTRTKYNSLVETFPATFGESGLTYHSIDDLDA